MDVRLAPGRRFWFWLSDAPPQQGPALLLSSLDGDPQMRRMKEKIAQLPDPRRPAHCGVSQVHDDGTVSFSAVGIGPGALATLAAWVEANVAATPSLARLRGARVVSVSDAGVVDAVHHDRSLWAGPRPAPPPESVLDALRPGEAAAFAIVNGAVVFAEASPDGLADAVARVAGERPRKPVIGSVQRAEAGRGWLASARAPLSVWVPPLQAWLASQPGAAQRLLRHGVAVRTRGDDFVAGARLAPAGSAPGGPDLSETLDALLALSAEKPLAFWFGPQGLFVARSPRLLRARLAAAGVDVAQGTRGRLLRAQKGFPHFTSSQRPEAFVAPLAAWVRQHVAQEPGLAALAGARFSQLGPDEQPLHRERDDSAWAS